MYQSSIATLCYFPLNNTTTMKWIINVTYLCNMLQRENHDGKEVTGVNWLKTIIEQKMVN